MACNVYSSLKKIGVSQKHLREVALATLDYLQEAHIDVSVHAVGTQRIHTLNRLFRGIDRPTDVLSFPTTDKPKKDDIDAGDIFICPSYVRKQAKRFSVTFEEEMDRMLIHGILHLRGYDHVTKKQAKKMFSMQELIRERIAAKR